MRNKLRKNRSFVTSDILLITSQRRGVAHILLEIKGRQGENAVRRNMNTDITTLLQRAKAGDEGAVCRLTDAASEQLLQIAGGQMRKERAGPTPQAAEPVHTESAVAKPPADSSLHLPTAEAPASMRAERAKAAGR